MRMKSPGCQRCTTSVPSNFAEHVRARASRFPGVFMHVVMVYGLGRFGNRFGGLELWGFWLGFVRVQRRGVRCLGLIQACGANP